MRISDWSSDVCSSDLIFFASVDRFTRAFQTEGQTDNVLIDVSAAHFWAISGVGALDKIVAKLRREGRSVEVVGYNRASADIIDKFALHDKPVVEIVLAPRSEERRVGKECVSTLRSRWSPFHYKKKDVIQ